MSLSLLYSKQFQAFRTLVTNLDWIDVIFKLATCTSLISFLISGFNPSRPDPRRIKKTNFNFYFHTFLWRLKRIYKGLHKTFWGTTKKCENKNLKLVSAIFYQIFINQMIALQKLRKMFFILSKKLFSFSRYSNLCIFVFPSFFPRQPLL